MGTSFIPLCAIIAVLIIAFLFASLPQINHKTRYRVLYAIAIIMLFAVIPISEYIVIDMELLGNLSDSITVFGFKRQCFLFSLSTANLCFEVFVHILPTKACQTLTKIV